LLPLSVQFPRLAWLPPGRRRVKASNEAQLRKAWAFRTLEDGWVQLAADSSMQPYKHPHVFEHRWLAFSDKVGMTGPCQCCAALITPSAASSAPASAPL
jgi:hypothetical protein